MGARGRDIYVRDQDHGESGCAHRHREAGLRRRTHGVVRVTGLETKLEASPLRRPWYRCRFHAMDHNQFRPPLSSRIRATHTVETQPSQPWKHIVTTTEMAQRPVRSLVLQPTSHRRHLGLSQPISCNWTLNTIHPSLDSWPGPQCSPDSSTINSQTVPQRRLYTEPART